MQINVTQDAAKNKLSTEHDGISLSWGSSIWGRLINSNPHHYFRIINLYWESKPKEFQDTVFGIYEKANKIFTVLDDLDEITNELSILSVSLVNMHNFDELKSFIFSLPEDERPYIDTETFTNKINNTEHDPSKTYLLSEYMDMIALAILMKIMTPIWGSYETVVKSYVSNQLKQLHCLNLIYDSYIMTHHSFEKMTQYIGAQLKPSEPPVIATQLRIAPDDVVDVLVARCVVSRFPTQRFTLKSITSQDTINRLNLVREIYNYATNTSSSCIAGQPRTDKLKRTNSSGDMEDKSIVEQYRITEQVAPYLAHSENAIAEDITLYCKNFFKDDYSAEIQARVMHYYSIISVKSNFKVTDYHVVIIAAALKRQISMPALFNHSRTAINAPISVACVILEQLELTDIVKILLSTVDELPKDEIKLSSFPLNELDKETTQKLNALYSYKMQRSKTAEKIELGVNFIKYMVKLLNYNKWEFELKEMYNIKYSLVKLLTYSAKGTVE